MWVTSAQKWPRAAVCRGPPGLGPVPPSRPLARPSSGVRKSPAGPAPVRDTALSHNRPFSYRLQETRGLPAGTETLPGRCVWHTGSCKCALFCIDFLRPAELGRKHLRSAPRSVVTGSRLLCWLLTPGGTWKAAAHSAARGRGILASCYGLNRRLPPTGRAKVTAGGGLAWGLAARPVAC